MCGIIGYFGNGKGSSVVMHGLKLLEYRGYDSWGIAFVQEDGFFIKKAVGKINGSEIENISKMPSNIALGHTRWATHGGITEINTHPHFSSDQHIAVVHNGIIENFQNLKKFLIDEGYIFKSETDTEVIPLLIEYFMRNHTFLEAFKLTLDRLEGSYSILVSDGNILVGARNGSPLVLGIGNGEYFLASDVPAFLIHTNKVVFLEDYDLLVLDNNGYILSNIKQEDEIVRDVKSVDWNIEQAKLDAFPHFMLKEIYEQKFTIKRAIEQDAEIMNIATKMIQQSFGVFFVGCGTSYHACVSASYVFSKVAKKHVNVVLASEFRNYEHFLTHNTLIVAVSQSGETADLLDAVDFAKKHQCKILSIVNVVGSTLTRIADQNILMQAGPEICVLSTKSYTSQLALLILLAYSCVDKLKEGKNIVQKVSDNVELIINSNIKNLRDLADKIKDSKSIFLIGRELAYPSALEGALKIKEVSYIHAEGFAGGELKHGTIALVEKGTPVIVLCTENTKKLILSNAMEVKSRGAYVIGLSEKPNEIFDYFIPVPPFSLGDPIIFIIPIQILAYYLAIARGCDPDKPRNLAKSVTVK